MVKRSLQIISIVSMLMLAGAGCISFTSTAAGPMGMFRSDDKTDTWKQVNAYPTVEGVKSLAAVQVNKFFFDPSDPNALYLATRGQGLYYSYNKGDSWQFADILGQRPIASVAVDPKNKCTVYVSDQSQHIFKTNDCSRSWTQVYTDARSNEWAVTLSVDPGNGKVYAGLRNGELLVSNDAGNSWQVLKRFATPIQYLSVDPRQSGRLYVAGVNSGFARSDDGGVTWNSLTAGLQKYNDALTFYGLVYHPTEKDTIYWLSKYGILRSTDAGKTWDEMKLITAPGSVTIYAFAVSKTNPKEMYYVGSVLGDQTSRSTLYKSTDGGTTWVTKKLPSNMLPVYMMVHPTDGNTIYMGFMAPPAQS